MKASLWGRLFFWQDTPPSHALPVTKAALSVAPVATLAVTAPAVPVSPVPAIPTALPDPMVKCAAHFVEVMRQALPTLDFLVVGEIASERVLASAATNTAFNARAMARLASSIVRCEHMVSSIVRSEYSALSDLQDADEVVEDVLISLSEQWHLLKTINNETHYIYLSIPSSDISLAIARAVLIEHAVLLIR